MSAKFRDLPGPVQTLLREQIETTLQLHEATGVPIVECRKIVLAAGGRQDLHDCIDDLFFRGLL